MNVEDIKIKVYDDEHLIVQVKEAGPPGKSAYQIWLENGNEGTEQDFLDSLKGESGNQFIVKVLGDTEI